MAVMEWKHRKQLLEEANTLDLLTVHHVAAKLTMSDRNVWNRLADGTLPAPVRVGHSTRWRRAEVEDWLRAGCPPQSEWEWGTRCSCGHDRMLANGKRYCPRCERDELLRVLREEGGSDE